MTAKGDNKSFGELCLAAFMSNLFTTLSVLFSLFANCYFSLLRNFADHFRRARSLRAGFAFLAETWLSD